MKPLRWLASGLMWTVAGLLGLVGGLLSITVILLPKKSIARQGGKVTRKARTSMPSPVEAVKPKSRRGLLHRVGVRG